MQEVSTRPINEVAGVKRVVYDINRNPAITLEEE